MLTQLEQEHLERVSGSLRGKLALMATAPWNDRRVAATGFLQEINDTWWRVHGIDPTAYQRDLDSLNRLAGWKGDFAQVSMWSSAQGQPFLMPPKFFGGDPMAMDENFVASMSLNHASLPGVSTAFERELSEQQEAGTAFSAHREYFSREYAYARFFLARAKVLQAFAHSRGLPDIPTGWRELNRRYAFYIELVPTWSRRFRPAARAALSSGLITKSFVMALNKLVHDVTLRVLQPRWVLLAGKQTWGAWPDPGFSQMGRNVGNLIRSNGKPCPVYVLLQRSAASGKNVLVVRTNFFRTVYGPNSDLELQALGRDVLSQHEMEDA